MKTSDRIRIEWDDLTPDRDRSPGSRERMLQEGCLESPSADLPHVMKANRRVAGQICSLCRSSIQLAEDLRYCEHCKQPYHLECWTENRGCATYGCRNAPGAAAQISSPPLSVLKVETDKSCGKTIPTQNTAFCRECGKVIPDAAAICVNCGVLTGTRPFLTGASGKSRVAYVFLGLFLGCLGIHNFYAGYMGKALAQLLITLFLGWLILPWIAVVVWVLVEICIIGRDAQGIPFS